MGAVKRALEAKAEELGLDPLRMHEWEDVIWFEIQHEACRKPIVVCNTRTQDTREIILRAAFVRIGDKPQPHVLYNGYWRAVERVGGVLTILDNRPDRQKRVEQPDRRLRAMRHAAKAAYSAHRRRVRKEARAACEKLREKLAAK